MQKSRGGLDGILRGRIATRKRRAAQMSNAIESLAHTAQKNLATPNRAIIAIAGAVETDAEDAFVPGCVLGQNRGDVSAMMLHCDFGERGQAERMHGGSVLRVRIVGDEEIVVTNFIHGNEVADGFLES